MDNYGEDSPSYATLPVTNGGGVDEDEAYGNADPLNQDRSHIIGSYGNPAYGGDAYSLGTTRTATLRDKKTDDMYQVCCIACTSVCGRPQAAHSPSTSFAVFLAWTLLQPSSYPLMLLLGFTFAARPARHQRPAALRVRPPLPPAHAFSAGAARTRRALACA